MFSSILSFGSYFAEKTPNLDSNFYFDLKEPHLAPGLHIQDSWFFKLKRRGSVPNQIHK
jgi:hypothetical protein